MFAKSLSFDLNQYAKKLWPYATATMVTAVVACLITVFDSNGEEMTGIVTTVGIFAMTATFYVVRGFAHAYMSFYNSIKSDSSTPISHMLGAQICAFVVFIAFTALFMLGLISAFAWSSVAKMFAALSTEWPYFIEFLAYLPVVTVTAYTVPTAMIAAKLYGNNKIRVMCVGCCTLLACLLTIVPEVLFLIHDASTDVQGAMLTVIVLSALFIPIDVWLYARTYKTLIAALPRDKKA